MDNQDGPWSVSVAETPYDARSYSLYIKSKSHVPFHSSAFMPRILVRFREGRQACDRQNAIIAPMPGLLVDSCADLRKKNFASNSSHTQPHFDSYCHGVG